MIAAALSMTDEQRLALAGWRARRGCRIWQVVQARALLWAGDEVANGEIARRLQVDSDAVRRRRRRFAEVGVDG